MAISIQTELSDHTISSAKSYKYLFEPLRVRITETGSKWVKITVLRKSPAMDVTLQTYADYFFSETDATGMAVVDLMEIARDFYGEIYKLGHYADISLNPGVLLFVFQFKITTDLTATATNLSIIPVIGGRSFDQFNGDILHTAPLTEWAYYGITQPLFKGYPKIEIILIDPVQTYIIPTVNIGLSVTGRDVCGGYLIWKSRFGGWMTYGFDIFSETESMEYNLSVDSNLFEGNTNRRPYVPVNYAQVENSYNVSLKALSVSKEEAQALKSLNSAPVAFLMRSTTSKLELMRISSASIPINNLANGVDVQVTLSSVSTSKQNVR